MCPSKWKHEVIFHFNDFHHTDTDKLFMRGAVVDPFDKAYDWRPINLDWRPNDVVVNFNWPDMGLINFNKGCARITQRPRRQWKLGFNSGCVSIWNVNKYEQQMCNRRILTGDDILRGRTIKEIFYPRYFTPYTLYEAIGKGERLSGALSPKFFNATIYNLDDIFLGYKTIPIGKVIMQDNDELQVQLFRGNEFLHEQVSNFYTIREYI